MYEKTETQKSAVNAALESIKGNYAAKFLVHALFALTFLAFANVGAARGDLNVSVAKKGVEVAFGNIDEGSVLVSATDASGRAVSGLGEKDFVIAKNGKIAKILSVEPILTEMKVGLNIAMVVDNSYSMKDRKAVEPLLAALDKIIGGIRPIDRVHLIVFDDANTVEIDNYDLHVGTESSYDPALLNSFARGRLTDGITQRTYLYDAMYAGIDLIKKMPEQGNRFMVVFSDGEEINSVIEEEKLEAAAEEVDFRAYVIDYMPKKSKDPFLFAFAEKKEGRLWKAGSADELLPIFEDLSTAMFRQYVVKYRFANPPEGVVSIEPSTAITIEEITAIESSPFLNYVFFDQNSSEIPDRYVKFADQSRTESFDPGDLEGAMEKHLQSLNILGKRMRANPGATVTLVGCNSGYGRERNDMELSRGRADSVAHYLRYIWGIDPSRIDIQTRNRPAIPSTNRVESGRAENRRVEIYSDHPSILSTVNSTYPEKIGSVETIRLVPRVRAEAGIENWTMNLYGDGDIPIKSISGKGEPEDLYAIRLKPADLDKIAGFEKLVVGLKVEDNDGEIYENLEVSSLTVRYIRKQQMEATQVGQKIYEKYALILFDFDSAEIEDRNREILDVIIQRIQILPKPRVDIIGHTDSIGSEDYNKNLSVRRAESAYGKIASSVQDGVSISRSGVGEVEPIYDNGSPEGRMLNRTVTVTLIYEMDN